MGRGFDSPHLHREGPCKGALASSASLGGAGADTVGRKAADIREAGIREAGIRKMGRQALGANDAICHHLAGSQPRGVRESGECD